MNLTIYRGYSVRLVNRGGDWFVSSIAHSETGARLAEPGFNFDSDRHAMAFAKGLIDSMVAVAAPRQLAAVA